MDNKDEFEIIDDFNIESTTTNEPITVDVNSKPEEIIEEVTPVPLVDNATVIETPIIEPIPTINPTVSESEVNSVTPQEEVVDILEETKKPEIVQEKQMTEKEKETKQSKSGLILVIVILAILIITVLLLPHIVKIG